MSNIAFRDCECDDETVRRPDESRAHRFGDPADASSADTVPMAPLSATEAALRAANGRTAASDMPPTPPTPAEPAFLVADKLSAIGPEGVIFSDLSLSANRGEVVGLTGESGTGRTAALLALAGRFACKAGSLRVNGHSKPSRIRRLVSVASAAPAVTLDPHHTVAQLITETALVGRVSRDEVVAACRLLGVSADSGTGFGHVTKVDQTLLSLAFAASHRCPVVVLDDLDSGVDDTAAARIWTAARRVADNDRLVVVAAVRPSAVADQLIAMRTAKSHTIHHPAIPVTERETP